MHSQIHKNEMKKTNLRDLTGMKFGKWTVIQSDVITNGRRFCLCVCECGTEKLVDKSSLIRGKSTQCHSCSLYKHGGSNTRLYRIWKNMKQRCSNPKASKFELYGGKGITVCDSWKNSFENFAKWSYENGYTDELSIDRIDSNKNYCSENCRWTTYKEQGNNTSANHLVTYNGITQTLSKWADSLNLPYKVVSERIRRNWSVEKTFNTPVTNMEEFNATQRLSNGRYKKSS